MSDAVYKTKKLEHNGDKYIVTYFNSKILGSPVVVEVICQERRIIMDPEKNKDLIDAAMLEVER